MKKNIEVKLKILKKYFNNNKSIKEIAIENNIHPVTLSRWIKKYKNYTLFFTKYSNSISKIFEEKIVSLKENKPDLTLIEAKIILKKKEIFISIASIRKIWMKYNVLKRPITFPFTVHCIKTKETTSALDYVRELLHNNNNLETLRKAAQILNNLPSYPIDYNDVIFKIPQKYLNMKMKLNKIVTEFRKIPMPEYLIKIRNLRKKFEKIQYYYSALLCSILEFFALAWMDDVIEIIKLYNLIKNWINNLKDPVINMFIYFQLSNAYYKLLMIDKAYIYKNKCKVIIKTNQYSKLLNLYIVLLSFFIEYKNILKYIDLSYKSSNNLKLHNWLNISKASCYFVSGNYKKAEKLLYVIKKYKIENFNEHYNLSQFHLFFVKAELFDAGNVIKKILKNLKEHRFLFMITQAVQSLSAIEFAYGNKDEGLKIINKFIPLLKKYKLKKHLLILEILTNKKDDFQEYLKLPIFKLLFLLKKSVNSLKVKDYNIAYKYAVEKNVLGLFHLYIVFYSEIIIEICKKKRKNHPINFGLTKKMLRFPVFQNKNEIIKINLLGNFEILKNNIVINTKFTIKEKAFLIHLAFKLIEPEKKIKLQYIYENFWNSSYSSLNNLSHLLVSLRKKLNIPTNSIKISKGYLYNNSIYFITDLYEFKKSIYQANAFRKINAFDESKREFENAFLYFRDIPFKKMYDRWSEDKRNEIIIFFNNQKKKYESIN